MEETRYVLRPRSGRQAEHVPRRVRTPRMPRREAAFGLLLLLEVRGGAIAHVHMVPLLQVVQPPVSHGAPGHAGASTAPGRNRRRLQRATRRRRKLLVERCRSRGSGSALL